MGPPPARATGLDRLVPVFLESDKAIMDAVERIAAERGVAMATVAMARVLKSLVSLRARLGACLGD